MSKLNARFNNQDRPEFTKVLNARVNDYFKQKGISRFGNLEMKLKSAFILVVYFTPLVLMYTGLITNTYAFLGCWVIMGFGMSLIGLSIMHDANHGSYSNNKHVNTAMGILLNLIGGYHINWKIQHNVLHHTYTNIHEHDGDIENILIRMSPIQDHKKVHKLQRFYAPLLYSLLSIYWLIAKDFVQISLFKKNGLLEKQGKTVFTAVLETLFFKIVYIVMSIVLVTYLTQFSLGIVITGFVIAQLISGLILAFIFQPAHVQPQILFSKPNEHGSVENSWAIHQMMTTTNFATGNKIFSWFIGGLNYQVEHHLFPNICHVHYRKISTIVKATAEEFGVPYQHQKTFFEAVGNHLRMIRLLGKYPNPQLS